MDSIQRGHAAEKRAAQYFLANGYQLIGQRVKTPYAEVDLLLERGEEIFVVEVKSCHSSAYWPARVKKAQKERLARTMVWLGARQRRPIRLIYAYVDRENTVSIIFPLES